MSSLINKVKDKLHSDNKTEQPEGTHGPHSSRTGNAADPRVDSDRDHRENLGRHDGSYTTGGDNYSYGGDTTTSSGVTGSSGMTGTGGTFDSSKGSTGFGSTGFGSTAATGPASKTAGMHSSNVANKADPRVDSDLDASRNMGLRSGGATAGTDTYGSSNTQSETTGFGTSTGPASKTAGTHKSDMLNKADPRVDSDLDGSRNMGLKSHGATYDAPSGNTGMTGSSGTAMGSGMGSGMGTDTLTGSGATGTYGSSGRDTYGSTGTDTLGSSGTGAYGSTGTDTYGSTGTHGSSGLGSTGHHTKDTTSSAFGAGTGSVGGSFGTARNTGPAPNTAGPHKSDMMNKADPRVDSDLDNSKTFMGDKTFSQSDRTTAKDPTDAAQVPPSVLRKHIGEPTIEHDNANYDRVRRHSVSHQEQHRGL
ncbi:hypothetical protein N5P37_008519 [Trichoderma harzianum]|uniref:Uncharacterized protein n=1 Tax=Trichoderma harzianum CBS 226.95 TaxID=983964 RepID=A0A2T4ALZ9_TRIHA|nr:hypothetical protein M431DRAFT_3099 [Trichoderma harzianum CBS 226.95]KAK0759030.1 hypothetical protein N5P37_008519 [Trichoderma harzianum]PTB58079.1 hypothetical protein M431DRAFT_3099 [Trichoderma harzianum CBS 226.95]